MQSISIDVRMSQHTGIGRYIRGLLSALSIYPAHWQYHLIGNKDFRKQFPLEWPYHETEVPIYSLREQMMIPQMARHSGCLHVPHYNAPLLWRKKLVVTIHDLIHLHFKEDLPSPLARLYAQTILPEIVNHADHMIAVSQYTKDDLVKTLGANPAKITVVHHGIDSNFLEMDAPKPNSVPTPSSPYFLYVGLLKKHKNIGNLIDAFLNLRRKLKVPEINLILVGNPDQKQSVVREWLEKIRKEESIQLLSHISDEKLRELYRHAIALVCPSLYEGFGFPLLEAMASRIPIIAAHASSIPEVLGEATALFFDPYSVIELETRMEEVLKNQDLCQRLIKQGGERLSLFDWKIAAQKTEQVYESVLGSN